MYSLPVGIAIIVAVLLHMLSGARLDVLLNTHALTLVVGGTIGILALSTHAGEGFDLTKNLFNLLKREPSLASINKDLIAISRNRHKKLHSPHPLIAYAQNLWEEGVEDHVFSTFLFQKIEELNRSTETSVAVMKNLAKYPPALGMTGTVFGLVSLFSELTPDSKQSIGPSLALAMTATFYGLIVANALVLPIADRLHIMHLRKEKVNETIFRALILIHKGEPLAAAKEESYDKAA